MLSNPLTNFEIQKYYQNKPRFNGVYLRNKQPEIKYGTYAVNLDEHKSIGTNWIYFYTNGDNNSTSYNAIYFGSFEVEDISKHIKIHRKKIS